MAPLSDFTSSRWSWLPGRPYLSGTGLRTGAVVVAHRCLCGLPPPHCLTSPSPTQLGECPGSLVGSHAANAICAPCGPEFEIRCSFTAHGLRVGRELVLHLSGATTAGCPSVCHGGSSAARATRYLSARSSACCCPRCGEKGLFLRARPLTEMMDSSVILTADTENVCRILQAAHP